MKHILLLIAFAILFFVIHAQKSPANEYLSTVQVKQLFTNSVRRTFDINFPILRVYHYFDRSGQYYCVFTESLDSIKPEGDSLHRKIRVINLRKENGGFYKIWDLNDFISPVRYEQSIWFWTKYVEFKDYDNDSLVEPLIVYGTLGLNDYDDGRIKFLIFYKGQKVGIRYQGCVEDCRSIVVDKAFYSLPEKLQKDIRVKMRFIEKTMGVIYPRDWEDGFNKGKLNIDD